MSRSIEDHQGDKLFEDLFTHHDAWRKALVMARDNSPEPTVDIDDAKYWQHEIDVFDETYAKIM